METISRPEIKRISSSALRQLTGLKIYKSLFAIFIEWGILISCILLHTQFPNPFVYVLIYVIIATRLYALYSLIHEAIHHLIVKNKLANDIIAQLFLGFPLFINLKEMRAVHFAHHKYLFTDNDPEMKLQAYNEFTFPKTKLELINIVLLDISGINFIKYKLIKLAYHIKSGNLIKALVGNLISIIFFAIIMTIGLYFNILDDLFLYWFLPYATLYQLLNRLRLATEHFNIEEDKALKTRSMVPSWFQKLTIIPYNLGYHTEHHLYPGVPFYNLPKLQQVLIRDEAFRNESTIENGFFSISKQYLK